MKLLLLIVGAVVGLTTFSVTFAAVPKHLTDDTALYQEVSQIRVSPSKELNFDNDIEKLAKAEKRYKEDLPAVSPKARIYSPLARIEKREYRALGSRNARELKRINKR